MSLNFNNRNPRNNSSFDIEQLQKRLSKQQNQDEQLFPKAMSAGIVVAFASAIAWATVTYFIGYQIGIMAIGIGFLVGVTILKVGKSSSIHFGLAGGFLSLLGCIFGNLLTTVIYIADQEAMEIFEVLAQLDFVLVTEIMIDTFDPMDLLFYGLAVYYGYKYAIAPSNIEPNKKTNEDTSSQS